ncbi:DEAD/DEAH box helicase family protein (plasmid) [Aquimarina sp. TRL1]|uniref:DEAD/DEAH box helicase n=1 Tax=Aquimarina sp. (strain TRL1) TaxID=2736252 RepID=UPI00158A62A9|nr:DEAD/DEAH box helicase [Aquimarina sp. TRL1]QKX07781.1 DEAD/DEAH box helicase family protein [Aquimarina sp. TRL1]
MNHTETLGTAPTGQLFLNFNSFNDPLYKAADLESIISTLPELYPEQQFDVLKAEKRFLEGKGILFTNGTGTGKTFVGLGIAKRFSQQLKNNTIIVVPTDKKAKDWIVEGTLLGLNIRQLENIYDIKSGIIVTTYSNFYQNEKLINTHFDLVIYDECHYLLQNASGNYTEALKKHKDVAKLPSSFDEKFRRKLKKYCTDYSKEYDRNIFNMEKFEKMYNKQITEYISKTKVVFLSASPFAYHKSVLLGDGCLWNLYEKTEMLDDEFKGYNEPGDYENFFIENFGYKMRYNKLTVPDKEVNVGLMERNFYQKFEEKGIISGRQIEVDKDYSREFIIVNSNIGKRIDQGKELFYSSDFRDNYEYLSKYVDRKFNYNYTNQLLECIKAKEIIFRIKEHLKLGRKIIIFHNYNNSLPSHPFHFDAYKLTRTEEERYDISGLISDIQKFEEEYPELVNLDLSDLDNPRQTIRNAFPELKEFNGTIPKKKRSQYLEDFNSDFSKTNILMVQTKAGKEGISLHDKTGNKSRILITLGLPTAPTDAIQIEGRTYRIGLKSNAIYEYITLQTNFERMAFADKIATRSRTAENLAMGEKARNLETVFKEGYLNAHQELPSIQQGTGGKESDYRFEIISEFEKAKTYYFGLGKKTSKNRSREGKDYFATPEPLGYKIVQWLDLKPGQSALEPSAGHGAIGRFFPENTNNVFIEPSYQLSSKLSINVKGSVKTTQFENYKIWNKFEGIAMNPPFGTSGKLAMEHLAKATKHLSYTENSKIIAIVPNGPAMDKRLHSFLDNEDNWQIQITSEILLPSVVFERAGTKIYTKIIILQKDSSKTSKNVIDLTHFNDINKFFNYIEDLSIN